MSIIQQFGRHSFAVITIGILTMVVSCAAVTEPGAGGDTPMPTPTESPEGADSAEPTPTLATPPEPTPEPTVPPTALPTALPEPTVSSGPEVSAPVAPGSSTPVTEIESDTNEVNADMLEASAPIEKVVIETRASRTIIAVVTVTLSDACTDVGRIIQRYDRNTVAVNIFSQRPADMICAQMISSQTVEVPLEVDFLGAGTYYLTVNGTSHEFVLE